MVLARVALQSYGLNALLPLREKSLLVQPRLVPIENDIVVPDVCPLSQPKFVEWMSGFDQTVGQSIGAIHPSASAPTSVPSGFLYSRSEVFASLATLPLLMQL